MDEATARKAADEAAKMSADAADFADRADAMAALCPTPAAAKRFRKLAADARGVADETAAHAAYFTEELRAMADDETISDN
jgi:hypothetical protein